MFEENEKPVRHMSSIRVIAIDVTQECECHKKQARTVIALVLEDAEAGASILLDEDDAGELIDMIAKAREFATKANFARSICPGAKA
jgi:hypothetical protein